MPKRALIQKRPYLFASIVAALAWYYLDGGDYPEAYLIPIKGAAVGLLAAWLWLRHSARDARLMAGAFAAAALADVVTELEPGIAALLYFAYHMLALAVYIRHPRAASPPLDKAIITTLLLAPAVIAFVLATGAEAGQGSAMYALALGAMAAGAWSSTFPRYQVAAGAILFVAADLLLFAGRGVLAGSDLPRALAWPLYYLGQFLIATGVVKTLRKRDPQLRLVRSNDRVLH
ncbi:MAG: hypothetical protein RLZZ08_1963 [Pseudomonadota bacterium]